jgi:hypothetical protein
MKKIILRNGKNRSASDDIVNAGGLLPGVGSSDDTSSAQWRHRRGDR